MFEDPSGYASMMEMQVSMTMQSILMGGISNMFYVSLSNDAQENGMSIGEMLEAFAVGAIYTMLGLMVALIFEILCPALLILGIILSPSIVLYNGHNAMRQAQALGEDRQAAFCYITTIMGSLAAAVGGPRAAFDLMDYRMSNGIPRQGNAGQGNAGQGNAGQGCVGDESGSNSAYEFGNNIPTSQSLTRQDIINSLNGVTDSSTQIANAIQDGKIKINVLGDELFESYLGVSSGTTAVQVGNQIYMRSSSASIYSDVVHEGTHAMDFINNISQNEISSWTGEIRAYSAERLFQIESGMPVKFATENDMLIHIWSNYSR